jgi:arylsulfatase A-like enzyme
LCSRELRRCGLIVYAPKAIKDPGAIRTQYGHVIDVLPTTLELIGLNVPEYIRGIKQDTLQGTSLAYSLNDPIALLSTGFSIITSLVPAQFIKTAGKQRYITIQILQT